ncbi:hypothetical protein QA600_09930 [Natronococcus sp. A-GB1]|uniref:hypothetical protein n=1 Tax=Natronococcus sp. A-GB1 TaxID=3037648 RepID=UPI0024204A18|nr:hypothetical protein [Natronococcus sp. A-GB1]MDG5759659.1 hypothetical protein [Natronococcus sp. A-GB1]
MRWTPRTYLRLFLLGGGLLLLGSGLLGGELFEILIGSAGAVLGGIGLVAEWRDVSD